MRDVAESLGHMHLRWYITGSEALAAYGAPRQTLDIDLVVIADVEAIFELARMLGDGYYFAEPLRLDNRWLASLVDRSGGGKVDLILRDADPWSLEAVERRQQWAHPVWGPVWVSSLEDLILAKLEWSEGSSELQLRDCRMLLRMNAVRIDQAYLTRWARALAVDRLFEELWSGEVDAS